MSDRRRLEAEEILGFDEAVRIIREATGRLASESVPLEEARGRVLAAAVDALESVPPFDASTVDGFAVRAMDVDGAAPAAPVTLRVVAEIPAGTFWNGRIEPGACARISTGAPLPAGADSVLPLEWTSWDAERALVERAPSWGANIRREGEDVRAGERLLEPGIVLGIAHVGFLASSGTVAVEVGRRPRVAIACTGNELLAPGAPAAPGKIRGSNHLTLSGQVEECGGIPIELESAHDDPESLASILDAAKDADVVITSGGVSVGDHDPVKDAFARLGVRRLFWRVAASPGKPVFFGVRGDTLFFGLPGNPASSMITFECFVRPLLRRLQGHANPERPRVCAKLTHDVRGAGPRRHFARVVLHPTDEGFLATEVGPRGSGNLRSMARADALAIVPEGSNVLAAGTIVDVIVLDSERWSPQSSDARS